MSASDDANIIGGGPTINARIGEPFAGIFLLLSKAGYRMGEISTDTEANMADIRFLHPDGTTVAIAVVKPRRPPR